MHTEATIDGVRLFVRSLGDPAAPPLFVIHGGPTWDHSYLRPAVDRLTDVARVVLFDLPGCGRSHRVPPIGDLALDRLQPTSLADTVAGLIGELGGGPADVLGFSFGGRIAMRLVAQHPSAVGRLVLASTTAYTDFVHDSPEYQERAKLRVPVSQADSADGDLSRAMAHADAPLHIWRLEKRDAWRRVLDRVRFSSDYNELYASGQLRPAAPDDAAEILWEWGRPVLIVHGERDMCFPVEVARRLHAALPSSRLAEVLEAGHMAHFDNPRAWRTAIRNFLNEKP